MSFRQFAKSEGGKFTKAAVIGALAGSATARQPRRTIDEDIKRIADAPNCKAIGRVYRKAAMRHHSDKGGRKGDFPRLANAKESREDALGCKGKKKRKPKHQKKFRKKHALAGGVAAVATAAAAVAAAKATDKKKSTPKTLLRQRSRGRARKAKEHDIIEDSDEEAMPTVRRQTTPEFRHRLGLPTTRPKKSRAPTFKRQTTPDARETMGLSRYHK